MSPSVQMGLRCVQSKIRAHYERYFYSDAVRKFPIPTRKRNADLISTCIVNRREQSFMVYMLQVDLDFDKVRDSFFLTQKKISWKKVKSYLRKNHSYLLDYIFAATRSYGGKGLSVGISISPLVLGASSEKAAKILLGRLHDLFDLAGCGVDRGAFGLKRLCANWQNKDKSLYLNLEIKRETESKRLPVITKLLNLINKDPLLAYKRKKDQADFYLWPHIKTELGLAKLYLELFDNDLILQVSTKELKKLTNLSEPTLRSVLQKAPKWLLAKWLGKNEGWSLGLAHEHLNTFSKRAFAVGNTKGSGPGLAPVVMKRPEQVHKGERNAQITSWILTLKWFGVAPETAKKHVLELSEQIADQSKSRNLGESRITSKVKCIYGSLQHEQTFAIYPTNRDFPDWLKPLQSSCCSRALEKTKKNLEAPLGGLEMGNRILAPAGSIPRRVSADGHFQWKVKNSKNRKGRKFTEFAYYSVPVNPGSQVLVLEKEGKLQIFSKATDQFLCSHSKKKTPGSYATDLNHIKNISLEWLFKGMDGQYLDKIIKKWRQVYKLDGPRAYRKIMREKRSLDRLNQKGGKK